MRLAPLRAVAVLSVFAMLSQAGLRSNVQMPFYKSGHMIYAHEPALKELHDNVAAFIRGNYKEPAK